MVIWVIINWLIAVTNTAVCMVDSARGGLQSEVVMNGANSRLRKLLPVDWILAKFEEFETKDLKIQFSRFEDLKTLIFPCFTPDI